MCFYWLPGNARGLGPWIECSVCTQVPRGPSKLCQVCGSTSWVGSRDFYAHIWELWRHFGHMGCMLDSDWSRNFLLRCDWLGPFVALCTTLVVGRRFTIFCFVLLCIRGQIPITSPRGAYIPSGDLTEGFFALRFWGVYIWRGSYMEGLIFGILRYFICKNNWFLVCF